MTTPSTNEPLAREAAAGTRLHPGCEVCTRPVRTCWQFQTDDKYCGLCGEHVLHLVSPHLSLQRAQDWTAWVYIKRGRPPLFNVYWKRAQSPQRKAAARRPEIDLERSEASFSTDVGEVLRFGLEEHPGNDLRVLVVRLVPQFSGYDELELPSEGVRGHFVFATAIGQEVWPARLLPQPEKLFTCECTDRSIRQMRGVWQIYQKNKAVAIPMEVRSGVALCITKVERGPGEESSPDVHIVGCEKPVVVEPGKNHRLRLEVNSLSWEPRQPVPFHFVWHLAGIGKQSFRGQIELVEGRRLEFGGAPPREEIQLGEIVHAGFTLTASDSKDANAGPIKIVDCQVRPSQDEVEWLRVRYPTKDKLPLTVHPRSADRRPEELLLELDTTRLDRKKYDGKFLEGVVDLYDSSGRPWTCEIHVQAKRPPAFKPFVAIDWGTTNTCAAYSTKVSVEPPLPLLFDREQRSPELFPSDMYFLDVCEENKDNPIFLTGQEASDHAHLHPECFLRSVKRKFQVREKVFVMDPHGNRQTYTVDDVVRFLLHRLISRAEVTQKQEVHKIGFTFPTKWTPKTRNRFQQVLNALEVQLEKERPQAGVHIQKIRIDEANAVAIDLLTAPRNDPLPDRFHIIAYDFGGGTVDTCILEVESLDDGRRLRTHHVGIGGRADFGGDDVTRAVMMLLHMRLTESLTRREIQLGGGGGEVKTRVADIPLIPDGEILRADRPGAVARYIMGRANWDALWKVAELVKRDLCDSHAAAAKSPTAAPGRTRVEPPRRHLQANCEKVQCYVEGQEMPVGLDRVLEGVMDLEKLYGELNFSLDQACSHPLDDIDSTNSGQRFTVRERTEETIQELKDQCQDATQRGRPIDLRFIVLAGGGCRLPLIAQLFGQHFPQTSPGVPKLDVNPDYAKRRVAYGMANYLQLHPQLVKGLGLAGEVIHYHLGLVESRFRRGRIEHEFLMIVPAGTPVRDDGKWHAFRFHPSLLTRPEPGASETAPVADICPSAAGERLLLLKYDWRQGPREFGYFDLEQATRPLPGDAACIGDRLPVPLGDEYEAEMRLRGADQIEVCVLIDGQRHGPYPLIPTVEDPETELQA